MDSKDLEAEIHPLKSEDKKLQENLGNQAKKEDNVKGSPRHPRLSRCRTVAFFLSLFVCLFVVFVVSFIIPCPDRPASQGAWRIHYNTAGVPGVGEGRHRVPESRVAWGGWQFCVQGCLGTVGSVERPLGKRGGTTVGPALVLGGAGWVGQGEQPIWLRFGIYNK